MQVQYVYHCCLCLIFDQITMAQEQKYLRKLTLFRRIVLYSAAWFSTYFQREAQFLNICPLAIKTFAQII